jgi:predicted acylesterase/phospholipase RssA
MKSEYEKIIKNSGNDQDLKRFAYFGYAKCCLNLSQYNLVIKFLHDQKDNEILNKHPQFWLLGSVAHRKMNNNFEKATHFMRLAKQIDLNNEFVQKEAKKLEKLEKFDVKNYVRLLDASAQPLTSVDDFIGTRRSHKKSYRILSIDGGGIRGLIPAIWLREIEMELRKPIFSLFNMIAGTSTGAIIGAALTVPKNLIKNKSLPYSAGDIVDLYMKESKSIFSESGLINSIRSSCYTDTFRSNLFRKYFGDLKINDSVTDLVIPAIHENDRMSTFKFTKIHKDTHVNTLRRIKDNHSFSYYDALMASTAAPTYFPPHRIGEYGEFMDGGLTCNNPSEIAYHEAKSKCNLDRDTKITVLSLGTSTFIPYQNFHEKSYLPKSVFWGKNLKDYVLPPIEGDIDERMGNILHDNYNRW